ncbi:GNAT family N-acetyltransferase [Halegenticoccus tardaugens]|uniref:GNAT family N-acetyltransferase n=1 Tax=Halegenticoccus tardaugens TaxID=2071624 RepID=UPI00100BC21D|nr:GNAT family protein [Halegenticoccus tardaugens]
MPGPAFLRGERVELRTIEREDVAFLQRLINDPDVWATIGSATPKNGPQEEAWIESLGEDDGSVRLLVAVDGDPVGTIDLDLNETWGVGELGYMLVPEAWGNGYCTDAVETLSRYAFEERRLHKVVAEAYDHNVGSRRVLEKIGFAAEGVHREEAFVGGEYRDVVRYGLLADEFDG